MRQIRRWRQAQSVYMPGAVPLSFPTHEREADDDDAIDLELPENIPLVLPSAVQSARRDAVCLHQVSEYEHQLRLAQLRDSLIELRRVRRILHSLLTNHRTQIAGQGQSANTRSRVVISSTKDRITKFAQRYRAAYQALIELDPTGEWQETYLELTEDDNRGPGKEAHEQGLGDGSYTISWIWLSNPRTREEDASRMGDNEVGASEEEVNDAMRVQWATSHARMERWAEEVLLLQEEMRRVVMFLEWKSQHWLGKQEARLAAAAPSIQSGLQAYARKQAAIHRNLAVSFSKLWRPTLVSRGLKHSWVDQYMEKHGISLVDTNTPTALAPNTPNEGRTVPTAPEVPSEDSPDVIMAYDYLLLEEAHYSEDDSNSDTSHDDDNDDSNNDDDDDGDDLVNWDTSGRLSSGHNNSSDEDGEDDFDFDFDFGYD